MLKPFKGTITQGKQIASGLCDRYTSEGTIKPQLPLFQKIADARGYNLPTPLSSLHHGTINCVHGTNWAPVRDKSFYFDDVTWFDGERQSHNGPEYVVKTENFFLIPVLIKTTPQPVSGTMTKAHETSGYIYLPDPGTKESPDANEYHRFELLCPFIQGVKYGQTIEVYVDAESIQTFD